MEQKTCKGIWDLKSLLSKNYTLRFNTRGNEEMQWERRGGEGEKGGRGKGTFHLEAQQLPNGPGGGEHTEWGLPPGSSLLWSLGCPCAVIYHEAPAVLPVNSSNSGQHFRSSTRHFRRQQGTEDCVPQCPLYLHPDDPFLPDSPSRKKTDSTD